MHRAGHAAGQTARGPEARAQTAAPERVTVSGPTVREEELEQRVQARLFGFSGRAPLKKACARLLSPSSVYFSFSCTAICLVP